MIVAMASHSPKKIREHPQIDKNDGPQIGPVGEQKFAGIIDARMQPGGDKLRITERAAASAASIKS
jgi:hypothetical protein